MPVIKKASKKSMSHSLDAEMGPAKPKDLAVALGAQRAARKSAAPAVQSDSDEHYGSIADAILKKKRMAEGGMVGDDSEETPASPSPYDDDNAAAVKKELYDTDQLEAQPEDSNEIGDAAEEDDEDDHDASMVDKIRRKAKKMAK